MANQENNNNIELIESSIARFGVSAIGTVKTGIGFGLKHTGSGIVWLGRHVQDAGINIQISGLKNKFSAKISSIVVSESDKATKQNQIAEANKSVFEKIKELAEGVGEQIDSYTEGKNTILTELANFKSSAKTGSQAAIDLIADLDAEIQAVEQPQAQAQTKTAQPMPKATATPQPTTTNRNLDEEAFADC